MDTTIKRFMKHDDAEAEIMGNGITKRILSYDESLMVEELVFEQGAKSAEHTHTPVQIPYVKSGVFEFTVGGESFVLSEGDKKAVEDYIRQKISVVRPSFRVEVIDESVGVLGDFEHPL